MHFVIRPAEVVAVVSPNNREIVFLCKLGHHFIGALLFGDAVILNFDIQIVASHHVLQPLKVLHRSFALVRRQQRRDIPLDAPRQCDDAIAVRAQDFHIDSRFGIKALQIAERDQLHEISIARGVLCKQRQVIGAPLFSSALMPTLRRDIDLATHDGIHTFVLRLLVELPRSEHVTVIRQRHRLHALLTRPIDDAIDGARAVKKAVFAMIMKMYKCGCRHISP